MQVKKQHLEPNMELRTSSNWERSTSRLYIVSLVMFLYAEFIMQNAGLDEAQAVIKSTGWNISNLS